MYIGHYCVLWPHLTKDMLNLVYYHVCGTKAGHLVQVYYSNISFHNIILLFIPCYERPCICHIDSLHSSVLEIIWSPTLTADCCATIECWTLLRIDSNSKVLYAILEYNKPCILQGLGIVSKLVWTIFVLHLRPTYIVFDLIFLFHVFLFIRCGFISIFHPR